MLKIRGKLRAAIAGLALGACAALGAHADPASEMAGKKVIFVPISMGITLTEGWARRMREHAAMHGYSFEIRDAAFNTGAMSELLAKAISDKPDVLIVHNPTVQLLARQIKQAQAAGIKVLQINLQSNQPSAAFVGANWTRIGTEIAQDIVKECGAGSGKSGKVAIIPGQLTAADSVMMNEAAFKVFKEHPEIKVVSNQARTGSPRRRGRSPPRCCSRIRTCAPSSATGTSTRSAPATPSRTPGFPARSSSMRPEEESTARLARRSRTGRSPPNGAMTPTARGATLAR